MIKSSYIRDWVVSGDDKHIRGALKGYFDQQHREKWEQQLAAEYGVNKTSSTRKLYPWKRIVAVAASIALILLVTVLLTQNGSSPDALAVNLIETESFIHPGFAKGEANNETMTPDDVLAFNSGDFSKYIASAQNRDISSLYDQYYLALAYMKVGNYSEAIELFDAMEANPGALRQEIRWYHALSLVAADDIENGRKMLKSIQPGEWNYTEANSILQSIDQTQDAK